MLKELVMMNRSYRGYNETREVSREELEELIALARITPSSANIQPLKYFIAWERELTEKILAQTKWAGALPELKLPFEGKHPRAFIVILQDTDIDANTQRFHKDAGISAQTMLLGAVELGLGGCMIGSFNAGGIREALDLKDNLVPLLVIALGEPDEEIILTEAARNADVKYYRDEEGRHYVPKRRLEDIILDGNR